MLYFLCAMNGVGLIMVCLVTWHVVTAARLATERAELHAEAASQHAQAAASNSAHVAMALAHRDDEQPERRHL